MRIALQRVANLRVFAFLVLILLPLQLAADTQIYFNLKTHKVHQMACPAARRCTKNCVVMPRSEAYRRGGMACKICGG
jgi:hypothetical protein